MIGMTLRGRYINALVEVSVATDMLKLKKMLTLEERTKYVNDLAMWLAEVRKLKWLIKLEQERKAREAGEGVVGDE